MENKMADTESEKNLANSSQEDKSSGGNMDVSSLLKDAKLRQYEEIFFDKGYDDLEHIMSMTEIDINDLLFDVGLDNKPGHRKRFLAALNIYRSKGDIAVVHVSDSSLHKDYNVATMHSNNVETGTTTSSNSKTKNDDAVKDKPLSVLLPNELKDLIIPQPYTEQLNFYNELLREIYLSSYGLVSAMQLREYVLSQRTVRWRIHKDIEKLKKQFDNLMGSSSIPLDGNAINVKKYTADDLSNLTSKDCRRVENAAEVVQSLSRKVQLSVKSLTDHKISLFGETGTVKLWKSTELKFIDTKLDILKSITETIDGTLCKLAATSKVLKRKFFKADVDKQEEKRAEKRKKDNALKDRRDKELRMLKSCCQVLQLIAPSVMSDKVEDVFVKGKFEDIKVTVNDIVDDPALKPRFYLNALQYLKEKGIFDNSAIVKVDSFLKSLKIKKKDTMTKNEARKEKSELKLQSEKSQPTLFTLGFNRSKK